MIDIIPAEVGMFVLGLVIVIVCVTLTNIVERWMYGKD